MKKIILIALMASNIAFAQKVTVAEGEEKAEDLPRKGLYTLLELDEDVVKREWNRKLKEFGSVRTKSGVYILEQAKILSISETPIKVLSKVDHSMKGTKVWIAVDLGTSFITKDGEPAKYKELEKIVHDFGVNMYIADINEQIKEAEKVLENNVKEQEKQISKGENIKNNIAKNRNYKLSLEKKIVETDSLYRNLKFDSIQNVQNQKASAESVEKMKRAVDLTRAKINKVE